MSQSTTLFLLQRIILEIEASSSRSVFAKLDFFFKEKFTSYIIDRNSFIFYTFYFTISGSLYSSAFKCRSFFLTFFYFF